MSSPLSEPEGSTSPDAAKDDRRGWETWRKTMFSGGIVLLANALAEALMTPDQPDAIKMLAQFSGYGLLAAGFALRMRGRGKS